MNEFVYESWHEKGEVEIKLNHIFPIEIVANNVKNVKLYIDEDRSNSQYANRVCFDLYKKELIKIRRIKGFYAEKDETMNTMFIPEDLWSGGDGIYSFPLNQDQDGFPVEHKNINKDTLFVFGDTFVGEIDVQSKQRIEPTLMPNNSYAFLKNNKLSFHIQKDKLGQFKNVFDLEKEYTLEGNLVENLLTNNTSLYISAASKEDLEIIYDFYQKKKINSLIYGNYFDETFGDNLDRGIKEIDIFESIDGKEFNQVKSLYLEKAIDLTKSHTALLDLETRFIKVIIKKHRLIVGCRYLTFAYDNVPYIDVKITSNQLFYSAPKHTWLWLQDGIIHDNIFYFYPMRVISDLSQPEGLQFKVIGTMIFKVPLIDGNLMLDEVQQKPIRNYFENEGVTIIFGSAIMNHMHHDGYIYIYGYKSVLGFRQLIVSRVKPKDLWDVDAYEYFDGSFYSSNFKNVATILDHVSCEMSVTYLNEGPYKGKFIAIMTYDTNTKYVAFALGDSPEGPFSEPQKIYSTPEQEIFLSTTYTYNAKAHPHLSQAEDILVSYNTNTYNFEHNMSHAHIYRPRFIRLKTIRGIE